MIAGFANELCDLGGGKVCLSILFKDWSFGVVVREMLIAVNCIFFFKLSLI